MKHAFVSAIVLILILIFALHRGLFVGSKEYVVAADCCPDQAYFLKRCRYLFVTGISEVDAKDGRIQFLDAQMAAIRKLKAAGFTDQEISEYSTKHGPKTLAYDGLKDKPELDNGYCRLFAE